MKYSWLDCRLDATERTLSRADQPVRVPALAFDLLVLILRNRGRIVSDAVVRRALWPDVKVTDASLRQVLKEARRAIGDDGRRQAAIETVRGRGLRFVASVVQEGAAPQSLVGREDVLGLLEGALDESEAGDGGVTLLVGRAGIGKSAMLAEIRARAAARGWQVVEGWGRAGAESHAYALWTNLADALGLAALTRAGDVLPASGGISEAARFARFRAFERAVLSSGRAQPLLLCFDDLQLADRESLALVRYLAPALRSARVRVLGAHRPLPSGEQATRDLSALAADNATRVIELRGLGAAELRALVAARFGASLPPAAADTLSRETHGSPLLALEVARALAARGTQLERAGSEEIVASVALGVVPLVRRRLAALSASGRAALHAAGALGDPFSAELVAATNGESRADAWRGLIEAERASLIERANEGAWRFAHPLFAEAVAEDLSAQSDAAQAALHRGVFAALGLAGREDPFRSASHALRARAFLAPEQVVEHLRRAARDAWRMHALADAASWQSRAVEVAEGAGVDPLALCDLLLELGALSVANDGVDGARPIFDRAARIAREQGDAARLARAALGYAHRAFSLDALDTTLAWLRAAHAAPCGDAALEARVAARLGAELLMSSPAERDVGEALLRTGVARARERGDALSLACALADESIARCSAADSPAALALAREVAACGRHAEDVEIELRGLAEVATVQLERGDRVGFEDAFAACRALVRRAPIPLAQGVTHGIAALRALLDGRSDDAGAEMREAQRFAPATGNLGFGVVAGLQRFLLAREIGEVAALVPVLDRARAHLPHLIGLGALAGLAHGLSGDGEAARDAARDLLTRLGDLPLDRNRLATLAVGAELASVTHSTPLARALEPLLTPFAGLHGVAGHAATYWGSVEHALGHVVAAQGRAREAIAHFERAHRAHEALASPPWSQRSAEAAAAVRRGVRRDPVRLVS
jgi:DNA-binding winged helix-turn-helix (wHTH) protein